MLNDSTKPSIYKLSSRVPRFFLPGHGRIFLLIVRIRTVYTVPLPAFFIFLKNPAFSISISFFHKNSSFLIFYLVDCFYYTMNRAEEQAFFPVFYMFFCNSFPTCRGRRILAIYYVKSISCPLLTQTG